MSFEERYQLLELIKDEGARTFAAMEVSTGKKVTVFLFVGDQTGEQRDLFMQLQQVDRSRFPELIETGDSRGTPYAVTEPIGGLSELKSRLSRLKAALPEMPVRKPAGFSKRGVWQVPAELQSPQGNNNVPQESVAADTRRKVQASGPLAPGEFTQMFQAPAAPIGESLPELPKIDAATETPSPGQSTPGSFTQMFQAATAPTGESAPDAQNPPFPAVAIAPPPSAPGSFTQMFQAAAAPIGEPSPQEPTISAPPIPPGEAQVGPGEFTRFFSAASVSGSAPTVVPKKPESKDEFAHIFGGSNSVSTPSTSVTGMFSQPSAPQQRQTAPAPAPIPSLTQPDSEFNKIFGDTTAGIQEASSAAPPPAPSAAPSPAISPGEYTRMFGAQPLPQEPHVEPITIPTESQETSAKPKNASKMILMLIVVTLILLAAIAVIVVTMKK